MTRWTEQQYAEHRARRTAPPSSAGPALAVPAGMLALGRLPTGKMNRTEMAYDDYLQTLHAAGEVLWHKFEGIKLRLANNTFLTIDFPVLMASGALEMWEVKGFMMEDANVKIKVAASIYPFKFVLVRVRPKKLGGGWVHQEVRP